jgi:hypothetical protein
MTALARATQITDRSDLATATSIDRVIRASTAMAVLAVAGVAAYVSYWHAYAVVRAHGGSGVTARLEPATIEGSFMPVRWSSFTRHGTGFRCLPWPAGCSAWGSQPP